MSPVESPTSKEGVAALADLAETGYRTILALQDASGAYPASPTFSAYRGYAWFRDGSFIADGVSAYGGVESADRFFDWCTRVMVGRAETIADIVRAQEAGTPVADADMLPTRFTLGGHVGDDDWWDFQLDGYGTWLWAVVEHARRHDVTVERWRPGIELTVDYLVSSWHRPCFDWWEERPDDVHVSTLACISAGLAAVEEWGILDARRGRDAQRAVREIDALVRARGISDGHLVKSLDASTVDASLLSAVYPLSAYPVSDPVGIRTVEAIDAQLNVDGGVHRFLADTFYGGGQWPLLSCLLGLCLAAAGDADRALDQLRWAAATVTEDGLMPEQVDWHLLEPSMRQEWLDRWGPVATPLLWSHAMYLRLAADLGVAKAGPR